jgi:hypothetical protein
MLAGAATLLGISRLCLKDWLRHTYPDLAEKARTMRDKNGYIGGRPTLEDNVG